MKPIVINDVEVNLVAKDGLVFANSLDVAKVFEKRHSDVLKSIENMSERGRRNFSLTSYVDTFNRNQKMYEMNRDGFTFLVMGFNGEKADNFKLDFIDGFNALEAELRKPKDNMTLLLESALENHKKLLEQDERITLLEKTSTIDHAQQRILQNAVSAKVFECITAYGLTNDRSKELFANMYSKLKNTFNVGSYRDVPKSKFNDALCLIENAEFKVGIR